MEEILLLIFISMPIWIYIYLKRIRVLYSVVFGPITRLRFPVSRLHAMGSVLHVRLCSDPFVDASRNLKKKCCCFLLPMSPVGSEHMSWNSTCRFSIPNTLRVRILWRFSFSIIHKWQSDGNHGIHIKDLLFWKDLNNIKNHMWNLVFLINCIPQL
jgi:hypothetical protein